jgi:hypothetical protein
MSRSPTTFAPGEAATKKAAIKSKQKSPWAKFPACNTANAWGAHKKLKRRSKT